MCAVSTHRTLLLSTIQPNCARPNNGCSGGWLPHRAGGRSARMRLPESEDIDCLIVRTWAVLVALSPRCARLRGPGPRLAALACGCSTRPGGRVSEAIAPASLPPARSPRQGAYAAPLDGLAAADSPGVLRSCGLAIVREVRSCSAGCDRRTATPGHRP